MNISVSSILEKLEAIFDDLKRYRVIAFVVFLAIIYGFLISRINSFSGQQPSESDVAAQTKSLRTPHIDQSVVEKIQQLQDNSVQVKTLFSQARNNPFSEK